MTTTPQEPAPDQPSPDADEVKADQGATEDDANDEDTRGVEITMTDDGTTFEPEEDPEGAS